MAFDFKLAWLFLALIAYFLDALVFIADKYLISESIPYPNSYAFFVSILSAFAIFLIPFGVHIPSWPEFIIAFLSGLSFFIGILFLYHSIKVVDVTEVIPAIGALTAITTFVLSIWILREPNTPLQLLAFFLLVSGTLMMSYFHLSSRVILLLVVSSIGFGISYVLLKYYFLSTNFVNGLFWTRLGLVSGALLLLLFPKPRREIVNTVNRSNHDTKFIFFLNKFLAAAAFILLYYSIKIGNVVFINALQGVQYVFILMISTPFYRILPSLFEHHRNDLIWRRITASVIIIIGLILLFI